MEKLPDLATLKYNEQGLIPAIAQQYDTGEVLMMAWMNQTSLAETLSTGVACYWSRSRNRFWRKGESSGQVQTVKAVRLDCDKDTLLLLVDQQGVACHTGRHNCFYLEAQDGSWKTITDPEIDPEELYGK
ncbi:phosphoribosyl-AMP cyclohydrolase [Magnetococcus marinus MC-1]|uniref:Phosphoribosyl-AMP cyclohydrolase n=1 Tax=Magnetococcus marinus (strain ATCC BAA-1437 / JCM 17883 / MC-1) TaxID=156889 RepID=HIS3_MAGMM|nr:phosphoribosyl-AMP cyclohydrolase [Magnetococcus marinus]A0LCF4.1 RecName: Full=Phosphoribosyl-AMP cyclohydrolase; Short=PRA-CH [Magnetococcus marinus MC-1]ABK45647.1 phosphoribosyl-AMP cyclohydrolase [Magnetococcus marinus MC-1]